MPIELPSPLMGTRGSQWWQVVAWREIGYDVLLHGLAYAWEVSSLLVYTILQFLMVGEDGGRTR